MAKATVLVAVVGGLLGAALAHGPHDRDVHLKVSSVSRAGHLPEGVTAKFVNYTIDGELYEGYMAYPTEATGPIPGMLIVHQWYGLGETEYFRAEEAALMGYYAFAADVYGFGMRATNNAEAGELSGGAFADPTRLLTIAEGGLAQLVDGAASIEGPAINTSALVSTGYCFGGAVLQLMATAGTSLFGMALFHTTFIDLSSGWMAPDLKIQIHHAQFDFAGDAALMTLQAALGAGNVTDWASTYYGNLFHGFTDPLNEAYDANAAQQAHASMFAFFDTYLEVSSAPTCADSSSWHKNNDPSKDCAWVGEFEDFVARRCTVKGEERILAMDACPVTCGTC